MGKTLSDAELDAMYRSLVFAGDWLTHARNAFALDRRLAEEHGDAASVAFCDRRIKIIDAILLERTRAAKARP